MPLPALAALFARIAPAMLGEGELMAGLVGRKGLAAGAETASGKTVASMLSDLLMGGLSGESKPLATRETGPDAEERFRQRRHVPSAADLFGYRPEPRTVSRSMPIPLARTSVTAPASQLGNSAFPSGATQPGGSTFIPANAKPNQQPAQQSMGMLQQFTGAVTKTLGPLGTQLKLYAKVGTGLYTASKALETFVWGISESNRGLARWNGEIAASFAQLDIANMRRDIQTADATSGSTVALNSAFNDLMTELQPMRETVATGLNVIGILAAKTGQVMAILNSWNPYVIAFKWALEQIEENTKPDGAGVGDPLTGWLRGMGSGMGPGPAAPPAPILPPAFLPPLK